MSYICPDSLLIDQLNEADHDAVSLRIDTIDYKDYLPWRIDDCASMSIAQVKASQSQLESDPDSCQRTSLTSTLTSTSTSTTLCPVRNVRNARNARGVRNSW